MIASPHASLNSWMYCWSCARTSASASAPASGFWCFACSECSRACSRTNHVSLLEYVSRHDILITMRMRSGYPLPPPLPHSPGTSPRKSGNSPPSARVSDEGPRMHRPLPLRDARAERERKSSPLWVSRCTQVTGADGVGRFSPWGTMNLRGHRQCAEGEFVSPGAWTADGIDPGLARMFVRRDCIRASRVIEILGGWC